MSRLIEILVILLLFVGPSLLKALAKLKREAAAPKTEPSLGDAMKRLMEELDGGVTPAPVKGSTVAESKRDYSDEALSAWLEDMEEAEPVAQEAKPVMEMAVSDKGEYFSYENADGGLQAEPTEQNPLSAMLQEEAETTDSMNFDLRKAILYQTILENKYIDGRQIA